MCASSPICYNTLIKQQSIKTKQDTSSFIKDGEAVVGIEFGSTRIKAVVIGEDFATIAMGAHDWENKLEGGCWTYSLADIERGIRDAYAKMVADVRAKYGVQVTHLAALGISGMMHGYLPFDTDWNLLAGFRTWRSPRLCIED